MRVRNSSCLTLLFCMSIFSVSSRVKRNLCSSNRPRDAYLKTSKVIYSIMLAMRLLVTGFLADLLKEKFVKNTYRLWLKWLIFYTPDAWAIIVTFEKKCCKYSRNISQTLTIFISKDKLPRVFILLRYIYIPSVTCLQCFYERWVDAGVFSPSQREVKYPQELSQGGLIHDIYHIHFCDQEIQDTASCCNWKHKHVPKRVLAHIFLNEWKRLVGYAWPASPPSLGATASNIAVTCSFVCLWEIHQLI